MANILLAHSAKEGYPPQTYEAHIRSVTEKAARYAKEAEYYAVKTNGSLSEVVQNGALLHDLGKLDEQNQEVLRSPSRKQRHLSINHVDAGCAALKAENRLYSALTVYAHHRGLPDMAAESQREASIFRDESKTTRVHTDTTLKNLLREHCEIFPSRAGGGEQPYDGDRCVFLRMALSCLADADHTDTAAAYGQASEQDCLPRLRAGERLDALNRYVSNLGGDGERSNLCREMYYACRDAQISEGFSACDSPVGSGKTTAVMAHLLQQAINRNARRIFVVLPYTSII